MSVRKIKIYLRAVYFMLFLIFTWNEKLTAGAWTQPEHHGLAILGYSYYYTYEQFTSGWHLQRFSDSGEFRKHEWNLYWEYGLTKKLTFLGNIYLDFLQYQNIYVNNKNFGFSDPEVGLRYRLTNNLPQSLQLSVKIRGPYEVDRQPSLGNAQTDVELAYYFGFNWILFERSGFVDTGVGYRLRTGAPADELRFYLTAGLDLTDWLQIYLLEASGIFGLTNSQPQYVGENILLTTDFVLVKLGMSILIKLGNQWSLQAGPFWHVAGRTTGAGGGFKAALWFRF
ncbi:MAG: hypothetical protein N2035_04940 [Chthoniobacterales bacterium]|nr:hypothetical protein [Chthoniobacterales bacterium]